jgi:hypothetical protein
MATSKLNEKRAEQADLRRVNTFTITIQATESNIQRLVALMLFAESPVKAEYVEAGPMPWEDPNDPRFLAPRELQIDYELVKQTVVSNLMVLVGKKGREKAVEVLQEVGATGLASVQQDRLVELNELLECAIRET